MFKSSSQQNVAKATRNGSRLGRPKTQMRTSARIDAFNTVVNCQSQSSGRNSNYSHCNFQHQLPKHLKN